MSDHGLLTPGTHRVESLTDDDAYLRCLVEVEVAWVRAQAAVGLIPEECAQAVADVAAPDSWEHWFRTSDIAARAEGGGNPVIPLLADLRGAVQARHPEAAQAIHRGLTSQDVMDTAMMLLAKHTLTVIRAGLTAVGQALVPMAGAHRSTPAVARTLTQYAVPSTFGLRCARWLDGIVDALEAVECSVPVLSVGGAAGTMAATAALFDGAFRNGDVDARSVGQTRHPVTGAQAVDTLLQVWGEDLGLVAPVHPWHTNRGPVLHLAAALAQVASALGVIANDVLLLSRPEIAELREPSAPGRGVSSAMPQKQNPVLSVLIRRTALTVPNLVAQVFTAASDVVDERPAGAWHAEWSALRELMRMSCASVLHAQELLEGLQVFPEAMAAHLEEAGVGLVAERLAAVLGAVQLSPVLHESQGDAPGGDQSRRQIGKAAVQEAIARCGGDRSSAVERLVELADGGLLPDGTTVTRELIDELCDPSGYTGLASDLVDRAQRRFQSFQDR